MKRIINFFIHKYRYLVFKNAISNAELLHIEIGCSVYVIMNKNNKLLLTNFIHYKREVDEKAINDIWLKKISLYYTKNSLGQCEMNKSNREIRRMAYIQEFLI